MKEPKPKKQTPAQILLGKHLVELGLEAIPEYKFLESRRFHFDWYLPKHRMGLECDGQWNGGHTRRFALDYDNERMNLAQMAGYRVIKFTNTMVLNGSAKAFLEKCLCLVAKGETNG